MFGKEYRKILSFSPSGLVETAVLWSQVGIKFTNRKYLHSYHLKIKKYIQINRL